MKPLTDVSLREFEERLSTKDVRVLQIIQAALGAGILFFGVVVGLFAASGQQPDADTDEQFLQILSAVNAAFALVCFTLGSVLYRTALGPRRLQQAVTTPWTGLDQAPITDSAGVCVALIRGAWIIRAALFEGPSFFAVIVCLLSVMAGAAAARPVYWLNAAPAVAWLLFNAATFPTRERLIQVFRRHILEADRSARPVG